MFTHSFIDRIYIYIYIMYAHTYVSIDPARSLKLLTRKSVASKDVDEDLATFYVFRDDIVMFPISYSIPKDQFTAGNWRIFGQRNRFHVESMVKFGEEYI